jgi:hypothetical protein
MSGPVGAHSGGLNCWGFDIRVNHDLAVAIKTEAKARGYETPSAFIRAGIEHALDVARSTRLPAQEERLVATIEQVRRELFRVGRAQQALLRFVDTLAKAARRHLCIPGWRSASPIWPPVWRLFAGMRKTFAAACMQKVIEAVYVERKA